MINLSPMNGMLLINKPENITSSDTINLIKKKFKIKKIGHSGTLDKFAGGLLIVGVNEGTKLLNYLIERDKVYDAVFELGKTTDTLDVTGQVEYIPCPSEPPPEILEKVLDQFIGEQYQIPPKYSAIKIAGRRSSDLIREGKDIELTPRLIKIKNIRIKAYHYPYLNIVVECSKGTYIRSLARDIGDRLKTGAYVKKLIRTSIIPYSIKDAVELNKLLELHSLESAIIKLSDFIKFMPKIFIDEDEKKRLENGRSIPAKVSATEKNFAALFKGKLFAIMKLGTENNTLCFKVERLIFDN
ncbi:MAG: tRNA pseudouridine(55) synthase TruB [Proteobacteria bacterium]|nr:tRNA pseudouridine(55) synthase TruB [Pseudomonadota bacterium]